MRFRDSILIAGALILALRGLAQSAPAVTSPSPQAVQPPDKTSSPRPSGVTILSDTQGVDFGPYLRKWYKITSKSWNKVMPEEVNPPDLKKGQVVIRIKVLPSGGVMDGSMVLEGRSGDTTLDRAAWGAITGSNYPALPREFHGPYLELRAVFMYNMRPQ